MAEPVLPESIVDGQVSHEPHHEVLHAWHNTYINSATGDLYTPADFAAAGIAGAVALLSDTVAHDGTTDAGVAVNAALAAHGSGAIGFGEFTIATAHPIIVPNGLTVFSPDSAPNKANLTLLSTFPHTTASGATTTPGNTSTTFTFNVASTAGFPMGAGGITPPHGIGFVRVDPEDGAGAMTVFYTGVTGTSFTGCTVPGCDINRTIPTSTVVGTAAVWMDDPGDTQGFGVGWSGIGIHCNSVPGSTAALTSHMQEGSRFENARVDGYMNGGFVAVSNPSSTGSSQPCNFDIGPRLWLASSTTATLGCIDIDIMFSQSGAGASRIQRTTIDHVTITRMGSLTVRGFAGIRLNAVAGEIANIGLEAQNIGVLIGDVYPCNLLTRNIEVGGAWGTATGNHGGIVIGNTAHNVVQLRNTIRTGTQPNLRTVIDLINSATVADDLVSSYDVAPSGAALLNGGGPYVAFPPPGLVQDAVAAGARTASSAATLTVTYTKATTVGDHCLLAACSSGDKVLTGVTDSRGNTWQVDVTESGQGVAVSVASSRITTAHQIGDTLTLTYNAADTDAAATVCEVGPLTSTSWLDKTSVGLGATGDGSSGITTTRSQPNEVLFGAIAYASATLRTPGGGFTPLTEKATGGGNRRVFPIIKVVKLTGTDAATWVGSNSPYDSAIATYKLSTTPPTIAAASGGSTVDTEVRASLASLLARLQKFGMIS